MEKFVKVANVTRTSLRIIDGLCSVQEAIDLMKQHNVSSLVIEKRHEGDEYGVVTISDIAKRVMSENRSTLRTSVYEIMVKPALTLDAKMNVKYAIRLLARLGLSRSLVLEGGELSGIVTLRDLVFAYTEQTEEETS